MNQAEAGTINTRIAEIEARTGVRVTTMIVAHKSEGTKGCRIQNAAVIRSVMLNTCSVIRVISGDAVSFISTPQVFERHAPQWRLVAMSDDQT